MKVKTFMELYNATIVNIVSLIIYWSFFLCYHYLHCNVKLMSNAFAIFEIVQADQRKQRVIEIIGEGEL